MKKLGIAAAVAVAIAASSAQGAQAAEPLGGPCETQQALFEKYGIGLDMYAPAVSYAYGTVCSVTG